MNLKNTHIPELIFKERTQQINASEQTILSEWKEQSSENLKLYHTVVDEENLKEALAKYFQYDMGTAWTIVEARIDKNKSNKIFYIKRILVAASIAVPLLIGAYAFMKTEFFNFSQWNTVAINEASIKPGNQTAVLTIDGGEEIKLGQSKSFREIMVSKMTRAVDSNFTLSYKNAIPKLKNFGDNTLETPRGASYSLVLNDGTRVWLNAETKIRYPECFTDSIRQVFVEGEVFFVVAHNPSKPFVVNTQAGNVRVLGTSFNVSAYNEEPISTTTLVSGKVSFNSNNTNKAYFLEPNQQVVTDLTSGTTKVVEVDTYLFTAWKEGYFVFKGEKLESIMHKFSRWYNYEIEFQNNDLKNMRFTGSLNKELELQVLLSIISESCGVEFRLSKENIIIIKNK